jgi:hypothetical protein
MLSKVRELDPDRKKIMWFHDLPGDPECEWINNEESVKQFDAFVFVSHWQFQLFMLYFRDKLPYNKCYVIPNGIIPIEEHEKPETNKVKLIYTPTPHRGLIILKDVCEHLWKIRQDFEIDVYSSFKIYDWQDAEDHYATFFEELKNLPFVNYYGTRSNEEVREALKSIMFLHIHPFTWKLVVYVSSKQ